jgi:DNA-binding transcriptional LysR family regulator
MLSKAKRTNTPHEMTVFTLAVERGSFSAAARELGLTPSGVSKIVTRIERRLGVTLLDRSTRGLILTPEGSTYLDHCRRITMQIIQADTEVARHRDAPLGTLRVHCGVAFGESTLAPALGEFLSRYPGINIDLILSDRYVDLLAEGVDLAIRIGGDADPRLVVAHVCNLERIICAAPSYLRRAGVPVVPSDLLNHNCVCISGNPRLGRWPFRTPHGPEVIEVSGSFNANSGMAVRNLVLQGVGIGRLIDVIVAGPIRQRRLVPLLEKWHQPEPVPLYCLCPETRRTMPKITALVNFVVEKFSRAPWRR